MISIARRNINNFPNEIRMKLENNLYFNNNNNYCDIEEINLLYALNDYKNYINKSKIDLIKYHNKFMSDHGRKGND